MKKVITAAGGHPGVVLLAIALVTLFFSTQLPKLQVQISAEAMLKKHSPSWQYYLSVEETFGSEDVAVVVFHDADLFENDKLLAIRDVVRNLEALPFVNRTLSLFNIPNLRNVDGFIHASPYIGELPADNGQLQRLKADALRNPLVLGSLLSADGQTMAVNVLLQRAVGDNRIDQVATTAIEGAISVAGGRFDNVYQVSAAAMRAGIAEKTRSDQAVVFPLAVLVLLASLALTLRRATAAILPLCTAGLSVVWILGFLGLLGIPLNIMTTIVPALIIVIGSTEDIHLLAEYAVGIRRGHTRPTAIGRMADRMGLAVLLTFVTTYVGFLSIALSDIDLLYQFGLAASTGLLFNFVITVLLVPVMLCRFGHRRAHATDSRFGRNLFGRLAVGLLLCLRRRRGFVFAAAGVLAAVALAAATQLRIDNSFLDYLEVDSMLRTNAERLHEDLAGMDSFSIVVDGGIDNTFLQVKYLQEIRKIQDQVDSMQAFDRTSSFADFVALLNSVMAEADMPMDVQELPESDDILRDYMLFINRSDVSSYVSAAYDQARIVVRHNIASSESLIRAVEELRTRLDDRIDPALRVEITGKSLLSTESVEEMARGQLRSLSLVALVIVGIVSLLFISLRAGLIALIPNLFPVLTLFGVMGAAGIPLNAATSMVAAIALGICVDDTIHVMSRFHEELKANSSRNAALCSMLRSEAEPIFATSIALVAGFLVFAISSFQPVVNFGVLSAIVIVVALAATFVLTPLLLGSTQLLTVWDLLSYEVQDKALRAAPLFSGMYVWQIKKLLLASEIRRFSAGERIITEGTVGTEMFLVLEGGVEAQKSRAGGTVERLRSIPVGGLFGEVAPLSGSLRTADVVAVDDARVLVLSWRRIDRLTHLYPILSFRLFRNLTGIIGERLTQTREYAVDKDEPADRMDA